MEEKLTTVVIPITVLEYIKPLLLDIYEVNFTNIVKKAYDYCTVDLTKEEREQALSNVSSKYYKLFINKRQTKTIHIKVAEDMKKYQASNLVLLYVLIYMQHIENMLNIPQENRFNV